MIASLFSVHVISMRSSNHSKKCRNLLCFFYHQGLPPSCYHSLNTHTYSFSQFILYTRTLFLVSIVNFITCSRFRTCSFVAPSFTFDNSRTVFDKSGLEYLTRYNNIPIPKRYFVCYSFVMRFSPFFWSNDSLIRTKRYFSIFQSFNVLMKNSFRFPH